MKKLEKNGKKGITNPKKDWKEWKDPFQKREKMKKKLERERSILNGNAFLSVPVPTNFGQHTSLVVQSQVDQGEETWLTKLNYKMNHSATFKRTKIVIHQLQPSCDARHCHLLARQPEGTHITTNLVINDSCNGSQ